MKVSIVGHTANPEELLIISKSTRLNMDAAMIESIRAMSEEEKQYQLDYMVNTVRSSWEFMDITFLIEGVSRAFTHQLVRTRNASYAQQAMRVLNMDGFEYYIGPSIEGDVELEMEYVRIMGLINDGYNNLIRMGAKVEDARGVLPTNIKTNIMAKFNLRALAEVMSKRSSKRVQPEYREVVELMYQACVEKWPWIEKFLRDSTFYALKNLETAIIEGYDDEEIQKNYIKYIDIIRNNK